MKVETLNLHGLNTAEALQKTRHHLDWCLQHGIAVLDLNHGKGHHSSLGFSVIKQEIRKMLKEEKAIKESGYKVIYGESDLPIALSFDGGHTLIVAKGLEKEYIGSRKQQEKNKQIFSKEGQQKRKHAKSITAEKRYRQ
ncbi:MAG: Smr/MutS family protein [Syntrophomonadaceae bacterium]|nr:Smr/MutS family protein [Syntrophomonadaceae bacterium]MDD3023660.1 Smr/MutS family protein [Syntrophomonadaceae bacterium]